jgi:ubiquinone/menaquinone biosynthesis C-methylase UbiE
MTTSTFKHLFSWQSGDYARFRPTYPASLYDWLAALPAERRLAVDVGTGNGQAAVELGKRFERVIGVDPSEAQLAKAPATPNIEWRRGSDDATGVAAGSADLLTVAQAFHWFKQPAFFAEVRRVVGSGGALAVWCYGLTTITPEVDAAVYELYYDYLDAYWEPERKLVEQGYRNVAFPFEEVGAVPTFDMQLDWTFEHLMGYLGTWSPLKRYREARGEDPLPIVFPRLQRAWADAGERRVTWPLSVRAFRL